MHRSATGPTDPEHAGEPSLDDDEEIAILCDACGAIVTTASSRREIFGAHQHTFMNPAGIAFTIGCYAEAPGCLAVGAASEEWAWFPKHAWRAVVCRRCATHLGWRFDEVAGVSAFHGLIVDRLRQ